MIPKLICFLFGHRRREKMYHGIIPGTERLDPLHRPSLSYEWKYLKFCPRCGKEIIKIAKGG